LYAAFAQKLPTFYNSKSVQIGSEVAEANKLLIDIRKTYGKVGKSFKSFEKKSFKGKVGFLVQLFDN